MQLLSGLMVMNRSLLGVGDEFVFGGAALLRTHIDGLTRGAEYGAIDAARVLLDGLLEVDFLDLALNDGAAQFDIIRATAPSGGGPEMTYRQVLSLPNLRRSLPSHGSPGAFFTRLHADFARPLHGLGERSRWARRCTDHLTLKGPP